jgi:DNA-binding Lrp family transcriptional regulator
VDDWLSLPALRVFKIRTHFGLARDGKQQAPAGKGHKRQQDRAFSPADVPYVRALQGALPLVPRPFAEVASPLGVSEEALLEKACSLQAAGIMRRFSAVLRHRRVGYTANGMACWVVPQSRIEEAGLRAAAYPQVSHCYQRPAYPPRWPYTLFTMIHGRTKEDVETVVSEIARETSIEQYQVLYSTHEFKKERVRYFEEET